MIAGELRERVAILRRGQRDALGGVSDDWAAVASLWVRARPVGSVREGGGTLREGRWLLTMRPYDVRAGDRIARVDGMLEVRGVVRDPATPDRIAIEAEAVA